MNKKVLAIGGHPDDMEQFAGGTLILLKKAGYDLTIAALTDGACGSRVATADEIIKIRLEESKKAAKKIGAKFINLEIRDGSIEYNLENTRKIAGLIRDENPEIIITHPTDDYMTDHWHTGALVIWAVPEAGHKNFETDSDKNPVHPQPYVYHTDPQSLVGKDGQITKVNTIVDVSDVIEKKLEAFAMHSSQMGLLAHRKKGNAVDKTRRWAITRGEQARVEYGEGFNQQLLAEYPRKNILKEILKDKVFTL
jgi:LmbE family N-acetylglucosaminyl deacetylase